MSLRLQINLIIAVMLVCFASLLIGLQLEDTRRSVDDEMEGANMVATQLLSRLQAVSKQTSLNDMREFLSQLGRVRANEIELLDLNGHTVYHSPPPVYKAGRDAPEWYSHIVSPSVKTREISLAHGRLLVRADPSRAVLDGWDDFVPMLITLFTGVAVVILLVYWLLGRALQPIQQVVHGLQQVGRGDYNIRLPNMRGQEAQMMGHAFNSMASSLQEGMAAREKAREATQALAQNRELTHVIQTRIEEVRGQIARELHDELGQQVTAIKSVGMAIAHRAKGVDEQIEASARMVIDCADAIYEEVHQLVTKLRPLALDRFGLQDALQDLLEEARSRHPEMQITLSIDAPLDTLEDNLATAVYRIMQESLTNALRHAQASRIDMQVRHSHDKLQLEIKDNGNGPGADWQSSGHFGVVGMGERAQGLGGHLVFEPLHPQGTRVLAVLPLSHNPAHG
jgi:two-component system sensor histidine kinase UhpB